MWLDYQKFYEIYLGNTDGNEEIPKGICSDLESFYYILKSKEENKVERQDLEQKNDKILNEIEEAINKRKDDIANRESLVNTKSEIFENTIDDQEDIESKIAEIDEKITLLDSSIKSDEEVIVQKKKELLQIREKLTKNQGDAFTLKTNYHDLKSRLENKSNDITSKPLTGFEEASIEEADTMIKNAILSQKNDNEKVINEEVVNNINSTKTLARVFQEEAKYERKAAEYTQKVLQQISDNKFSMKEFGEQCNKFKQTHDFIHGLGNNTYQFMVQRDIVGYNNVTKEMNDKVSPKDYNQIDELLTKLDGNFEGKIEPEEYKKAYDNLWNYREDAGKDWQNAGKFFNKLLNVKKYNWLDYRFKVFDEIASNLPYSNLPAINNDKLKFRKSLKVLESELIEKNNEDVNKNYPKVQEKEESVER